MALLPTSAQVFRRRGAAGATPGPHLCGFRPAASRGRSAPAPGAPLLAGPAPRPRTRWRRGRGGLKGGGDRPRAGAGRPFLARRPRHLPIPEPGVRRAFSPPSRHSWSPHQRCRRPGSKGRTGGCERASAPAGRSTRERGAEELGPTREDCASGARRSRGERGTGPRRSARIQRPAKHPGLRLGPRGHVVQRALQPGECGPCTAPGHRCGAARPGPPSPPVLDAPASVCVAPVPGTPKLGGRESLGVPGARCTDSPPRRVPPDSGAARPHASLPSVSSPSLDLLLRTWNQRGVLARWEPG